MVDANDVTGPTLAFARIVNGGIFTEDFYNFSTNNEIRFNRKSIAVLYAPNGVGKTSLAKVLDCDEDTDLEAVYNGERYNTENGDQLFHVVADQNHRNIIQGETEEFILGDDIKRERQLEQEIEEELAVLTEKLKQKLRDYGIASKSAIILSDYDNDIRKCVGALAKQGKSSSDILVTYVRQLKEYGSAVSSLNVAQLQQNKTAKYISEKNDPTSVMSIFEKVQWDAVSKNERVQEIGENADAISILHKYVSKKNCVVCDNHINSRTLLRHKQENREAILNQINEKYREPVEKILAISDQEDVFGIKIAVEEYFQMQDPDAISKCKNEIQDFGKQLAQDAMSTIMATIDSSGLLDKVAEYEEIIKNRPLQQMKMNCIYKRS